MYKKKYLKYKTKYLIECNKLNDPTIKQINEPTIKQMNDVKVDSQVVIKDIFTYDTNSATIIDGQNGIMLKVSFSFKNIKLEVPEQGKKIIYKIWENTLTNDGLPSFWNRTFVNEKMFYKIVLRLLNKCAELLTNEVNKNEGQILCLNILNTSIIPTINLYTINGKP